jgi:cyclase
LIRTGAAARFDSDPGYPDSGPALSPAAFAWLLEQGVQTVGTDTASLDGPLPPMIAALRDGRPDAFFPVAYLAREAEAVVIGQLDLEGLDVQRGFKIAAFPVKLEGGGAAWCRAVAFVRDDLR